MCVCWLCAYLILFIDAGTINAHNHDGSQDRWFRCFSNCIFLYQGFILLFALFWFISPVTGWFAWQCRKDRSFAELMMSRYFCTITESGETHPTTPRYCRLLQYDYPLSYLSSRYVPRTLIPWPKRVAPNEMLSAVELPGVSLVGVGTRLQQDLQGLVVAEIGTERHQGHMFR